jgi:hypothetical protein
LETEHLSVRESAKDISGTNQIIWGNEAAWTYVGSLYFGAPNTPPTKLLESKETFCDSGSFINEKTIAALECGHGAKLLLVSTNGQIIRKTDLGSEKLFGRVVPSQNGQRFAVPLCKWDPDLWVSQLNNRPYMYKLTAKVFSLESEKALLTVDVRGQYGDGGEVFVTPSGDAWFGAKHVALSPDGELLAVKYGPFLRVYQLPEPRLSSHCSGDCAKENEATNSQPTVVLHPQAAPAATASPPSQLVQEVLAWLPADTETVLAAQGPFMLPELKAEAKEAQDSKGTDPDIEESFESLPLGLLGFKDGLLEKHLKGEKILLGIEGSRHFQSPSGLGGAPFQGAAIAVFARDISVSADSFMKESAAVALRTEQIEGHPVAVFQEKLEEDIWTTFVAFPKPNMAVAATNEDYLREVLARMNGKRGERALPEKLPEWKQVNVNAAFWAVRHYAKKGAAEDPTSPLGGEKSATNMADERAIGVTFSFDPGKSKTATIRYLSGDPNILQNVQKNLFPIQTEPSAGDLHIRYKLVGPGVVEGSYDLENAESAALFEFVLLALLGHAIYI